MLCQVGGWCEQQAAVLQHAAPAGKWVSGAARSCLTSLADGLVWVLGGGYHLFPVLHCTPTNCMVSVSLQLISFVVKHISVVTNTMDGLDSLVLPAIVFKRF